MNTFKGYFRRNGKLVEFVISPIPTETHTHEPTTQVYALKLDMEDPDYAELLAEHFTNCKHYTVEEAQAVEAADDGDDIYCPKCGRDIGAFEDDVEHPELLWDKEEKSWMLRGYRVDKTEFGGRIVYVERGEIDLYDSTNVIELVLGRTESFVELENRMKAALEGLGIWTIGSFGLHVYSS